MKETALQVHQRKIRNGLRKQAAAYQRQKEQIWDKLKYVPVPDPFENIQVTRQQVHGQSRTLKAGWTVEEETTEAMYGLDVQQELIDAFSRELVNEQDARIANTRRVRMPGLETDE